MMDDQSRINALVAHYGHFAQRRDYEEMQHINLNAFSSPIIISLDEYIAENEGSQYDSGSDDDNAICDQIDRCAESAAQQIIAQWLQSDLARLAADYWENAIEAEDSPLESTMADRLRDFIRYQYIAMEIDKK